MIVYSVIVIQFRKLVSQTKKFVKNKRRILMEETGKITETQSRLEPLAKLP